MFLGKSNHSESIGPHFSKKIFKKISSVVHRAPPSQKFFIFIFLKNKYPQVQQKQQHAYFQLLNTFRHFKNTFFDFFLN